MRKLFHHQKSSAKSRGIDFVFTYDEWVVWWQMHLGSRWMMRRVCKRGKYVMARKGDKGPYAPWNVECIKSEDNHARYNKDRKALIGAVMDHLTREVVLAIYNSDESYDVILDRFKGMKLTKHKIYCIKTQRTYRKYTHRFELD